MPRRTVPPVLFLLIGVVFGAVMTQSQAISWYRIHEMFRFRSFHMYGIIGTALVSGLLATRAIRRLRVKDLAGDPIVLPDKAPGWKRYVLGGFVFGLGWALAGMCPGPMFVLIGHGLPGAAVALAAALLGTFAYGALRPRLPH